MTRDELFKQIAIRLENEGFINTEDYDDYDALIADVSACIGKSLDSYTIIKGPCESLQ